MACAAQRAFNLLVCLAKKESLSLCVLGDENITSVLPWLTFNGVSGGQAIDDDYATAAADYRPAFWHAPITLNMKTSERTH